MKLNGIARGGIICLFISSGMSILSCLVILISGSSFLILAGGLSVGSGIRTLITVCAVMGMILPILIIILGALAMAKGNNGLRIACGVVGLLSLIFVWIAWFTPAILAIVGGILTLCGKVGNNNSRNYQTMSNPPIIDFDENKN